MVCCQTLYQTVHGPTEQNQELRLSSQLAGVKKPNPGPSDIVVRLFKALRDCRQHS